MSKNPRNFRATKGKTDLKVISGLYRGTSLQSPQNGLTHPMGAREKLALFNMLGVQGKVVLDAYAGSGALGIEALSRGAREAVFVENNRRVADILQNNLAKLPNSSNACAVFVEKVGNFALRSEFLQYFDVIIADPPYDEFVHNPDAILADLTNLAKLLKPGGIFALSSPAELGELEIAGLRRSSSHTYARAMISLYYGE